MGGDLREGATSARTLLHRAGAPSIQQRIGRIEATSARIRSFQPTIVIGLLQAADYMRALLSGLHQGEDLEALIAARLARQQILDTDRTFHLCSPKTHCAGTSAPRTSWPRKWRTSSQSPNDLTFSSGSSPGPGQ